MSLGRTVAHVTCESCGRCVLLEEHRYSTLPAGALYGITVRHRPTSSILRIIEPASPSVALGPRREALADHVNEM